MKNLYKNSAWLYDIDNRDNLTADIPFYIEYAKQQKGEILELGCGTGRVALALASEGFHVTGLDLSEQMLDVFRGKLAGKSELVEMITLVHGNMADFNLDGKFSMIIAPFRAFQTLTDDRDIENALDCIYEHLTDNGIFIVNVFNSNPNRLTEQNWCFGETVQWERLDEGTGNYVIKKHWGDKIDTANQIIYPNFAFEVTYPDGKTERIEDDLKLKYYYHNQLRAVIEKAGMKVTEEYSWYDKRPPRRSGNDLYMQEEKMSMTRKEYAVQEFCKGYNCAQAVLLAFLDDIGIERKTVEHIAGGMGGGMRVGQTCGAVSGAVMVLGLKHGFELETKWDLYKVIAEFMNRFEKHHGSTMCKELLGYDFSIPQEQSAAVQSGRTDEVCPLLVTSAVEILEDMLYGLTRFC